MTALRKLGLPAEESELALLAHTSSTTGTDPDILAASLRKHYGADGLVCDYRPFSDLTELKNAGLTLAVVKYAFMVDHYVTVLEVTEQTVVVGDPINGIKIFTHADFIERWRFRGIVLKCK